MSETFEYDVLISHSSKDKPVVRELAERLKRDGLRVWLDDWEIRPGDLIGLKIQHGLESSRTLILAMSQSYFSSEWGTLEHHTLLFRDPTNSRRRFIPVLLEDCNPPDIIAQFSHIDWRQKSDDAYEQLLAACRPAEEAAVKTPTRKKTEPKRPAQETLVLKGHANAVIGIAITPDGRKAVSGSLDHTLRMWDLDSGECLATFKGHTAAVYGVSITPDGKKVVSGSKDRTVKVWDLNSSKCLATFREHSNWISGIAVTPDGKKAVSGSADRTLKVWDLDSGKCLCTLEKHASTIGPWAVAVASDGKIVVSGSYDDTLRVWDLDSGECLVTFKGHTGDVYGVAITPDGKKAVSGAQDKTLKVWDLDSSECLATFEGHTAAVNGVVITPDGRRVVSSSDDRTLKLWDLDSGECLVTFEGHTHVVYGVAITLDGRRVVSGSHDHTIRVWPLPAVALRAELSPSARYTNAKVVLVGESGVGKTGMAIRLVEDRWEVTDSTHGMNVWKLELPEAESSEIEREVWLWDFAGQPDYRLTHQLYMDETALALMVIDPQRDNPFESLEHWEKALGAAVKHDPAKLLVACRYDRGGVTVSGDKIKRYIEARGYSGFLPTSAKTGQGRAELMSAITEHIPWERLPWTATSRLFKTLKDSILGIKQEGIVLIRLSELRQRLQLELQGEAIEEKDLRAVVGLLAGQGLIRMLDFGDFVLLQPEQINNYASAVVRCARDNSEDIGCVSERDVLEAKIAFPEDMKRLSEADEKILLRAMVETFVNRSLCIREETPEGTQLVFPSYFKQDRPEIEEHPNVCVTYGFSGVLDEIYATLVVRLHYTNDFQKDQLWKYAADFKTLGERRVGLQMIKKGEAAAEIQVYFDSQVHVDTQVSFIKYVHEHLRKRAKDVTRVRSYVCTHCDTPLENRKAIKLRLERGDKDIVCGACEERVQLIDMIEEKFASDEFLRAVQEMDAQAQVKLDNESLELILVGHAFSTAGEAGQIFRPVANHEWGIDGEIEFKNDKGQPSGRRVYLQLKAGESYRYTRRSDGSKIVTIKNPRSAEYWQANQFPVMLVIRTSDGQIRWMNVTKHLRKHRGKVKHFVFDGEPFTALNVALMRDRIVQ